MSNQGEVCILGGNFNLIRSLEEKKGGIRRLEPAPFIFQDLIQDLKLVEVDTMNGKHT